MLKNTIAMVVVMVVVMVAVMGVVMGVVMEAMAADTVVAMLPVNC